MIKKVGILGCGWLGFPLAKSFRESGIQVNGSTTSIDKILPLAKSDINPFLIAVHDQHIEGNLAYFLKDLDLIIIDIPPRVRLGKDNSYALKIHTLMEKIKASSCKNVFFISSISVYGNTTGLITEESPTIGTSASAKQIIEAERIVSQAKGLQTTIIRLGGLYGPNRHPAYQLSKKDLIQGADQRVNLIHLEDCIGIIQQLSQSPQHYKLVNVVAPYHPTKKEYYTKAADALGLQLPPFSKQPQEAGKTVDSLIIGTTLNYPFKYPKLNL